MISELNRFPTMHSLNRRFYNQEDTADVEFFEEVYFYKYQDPAYTDSDEPWIKKYRAYKETPEGYWIVPEHHHHMSWVQTNEKKWLRKQPNANRTRKKLFAYQSKDDAMYSYYRRKLEHLRHLESKHRQLKRIIRTIETQEQFFGTERPMIDDVKYLLNDELNHYRKLEPLERERPTKEFIEDCEFEL